MAEGWGDMVRVMPGLVIHVMGKIWLQADKENKRKRKGGKAEKNQIKNKIKKRSDKATQTTQTRKNKSMNNECGRVKNNSQIRGGGWACFTNVFFFILPT